MPVLQSIVYVSTATMPTTGHELEILLIEARRLNLESGVTGVLLCSESNFMQCFEGPRTSMQTTWDRIRKSRRHTGIIEMLNVDIARRSFLNFEMGFARMTESDLVNLSTKNWKRRVKRTSGEPSVGMELLLQFWANAR